MREVKVKDVCDLQNGKAFKPSDWTRDGLPIIRIQNLNDESKPFNYSDGEVDEKYHIKNGDLLFSWSGTPGTSFGAFIWNRGEAYLNQHIYRVDIKNGTDTKFFKYALNSKLREIIDQSHGGVGLKHITKKKLENIEIPLPSLSEQKAIVAKLDRAQRLIDIDKHMLAKYDELIQSVFLEMFGDPVTNPMGLKEKEFGELVEITGGYAFKSKDFVDDESGVKVVKIANVHFIDLDWSDVQYLPIESLKEHEKFSLKEGDILLALTRPIINSLDAVKAVVVKESDLPAILNQRVARIRVDSDEVTEDYITSFIYTQHFKRQIEKYASTSLQPNVSNKEVSKIKVLVPEIELQRKFSQIRQLILNERDALEKNQNKSEELFSSLVQGVFG